MKNTFLLLAVVVMMLSSCKQKATNRTDAIKSNDTVTSYETVSSTSTHTQIPDAPKPQLEIPPFNGWVNDYTNLYTPQQERTLDSLIKGFEKKTTIEIAIATIDSSMVTGNDFEYYTLLMANTWGLGKKDKKNGILIAIAPAMKRIRIQNGYGIEKVFTNEETKAIINDIFIPYFRQGRFFEGTREGTIAIMNKLSGQQTQ